MHEGANGVGSIEFKKGSAGAEHHDAPTNRSRVPGVLDPHVNVEADRHAWELPPIRWCVGHSSPRGPFLEPGGCDHSTPLGNSDSRPDSGVRPPSHTLSANLRLGLLGQANTGLFIVYNDTRGLHDTIPSGSGRSLIIKFSRMFDLSE